MDGHIRVVWARGDGERVPLLLADGRDLDEEPLACLVLERRLAELDLQRVIWVSDDLDNLGCAADANFTIDTLDKVESTGKQLPSP